MAPISSTSSYSSSRPLSSSIFRSLFPRQSSTDSAAIIPNSYGSVNSGPSPGTVVGIVLGSVGGFLLVLWLLYTCFNPSTIWGGSDYSEEVVVRSNKKRKSQASAHSRRVSETVEVRRASSPIRVVRTTVVPERVERVVVEERREVRRDRSGVGSDEVVVIEDHGGPRRSKSKRDSRDSGYRTVDPGAYGGVVGGRRK